MSLRGYGVILAAFFTVSIAYSVRYGFDMLLPGMLDSLKNSKIEAGMFLLFIFVPIRFLPKAWQCSPIRLQARLLLTLFPALLGKLV
jgi:hypothetical protein